MSYRESIFAVLERTEAEIREIGAQAFRVGKDSDANFARDVVSALKALAAKPVEPAIASLGSAPNVTAREKAIRPIPASKSKYPKYEIKGGTLHRTGWSKKNKSEYTHKAPRIVFDRTVDALVQLSKESTGPFMADKIIERTSDASGPVPSYQAYLVVGFLKESGCLKQIGRDGYQIQKDIADCAPNLWDHYARS